MSTPIGPFSCSKRQTQARRACFVVLSGLIVFAGLELAAAIAGEFWFPGLIDPTYGNYLQRIRQGRAADPEHTHTVIVLGTSRTYYGLHPDVLNGPLTRELGRPVSVVNAAKTGAGPLYELLTWRRLRHDGVRPDLCLIEVLPAYLCRDCPLDDLCEERMPAFRVRWRDLSLLERYRSETRPALRREVALADLGALYGRRIGLLYAVAPDLLSGVGNPNQQLVEPAGPGMLWTNPTPEMRAKALEEARGEYTSMLQAAPEPGPGCDAIRELLASCRKDGVSAALILMPEGPTYRSWYAPETWNWIHAWLEYVGRDYGAPLINAREWIDEDEFMDSHHLLPHGAEKFSERLGREYILPLLLEKGATMPHKQEVE